MEKKIYSEGVISRLSQYLKHIVQLKGVGKRTVTSLEISSHTKINSAEIRRDLIFFGLKGKRGVGFNIEELISSFNKILGYNDRVHVALVGVGNLGKAILNYKILDKFGFKIEDTFDNDPGVIGRTISGRKVMNILKIKNVNQEKKINVYIIAG